MRSGVLLSQNGVLWVRPGHIRPDRAFWTTIGPHGATGREQTVGTWVVCATSATPQGPRGGCGSLQVTVGAPQVPKTRNGSVSAISLNGTEPPSRGLRATVAATTARPWSSARLRPAVFRPVVRPVFQLVK